MIENASKYSEQPEAVKEEILQMLSKRMIISKNVSVESEGEEDQILVKGSNEIVIPIQIVRELAGISKSSTEIKISNLNGRKTLLKYKAISDGFKNLTDSEKTKNI